MNNEITLKIKELISEYEYLSNIHLHTSTGLHDYYGGKIDGLKEALELINNIE